MGIILGTLSSIAQDCIMHFPNYQIIVGNYSGIARRVTFLCGGPIDHACMHHPTVSTFRFRSHYPNSNYPIGKDRGPIIIGSDCLIGTEAMIFGGVTVGHGSIVGARAVITKDIPPFAIVAGNPAKIIRYRFEKNVIDQLMKIQWWNWEKEKVERNLDLLADINKFLEIHGVSHDS
jgi:virginiamycin A acetyltransferase